MNNEQLAARITALEAIEASRKRSLLTAENRFEVRGVLALLVVVGGGYILFASPQDEGLRLAISNLVTLVLTFYFGSSQSNKENRDTINRMVEQQADTAVALAKEKAKPPPVPAKVEVVNDKPVDVAVVREEK